MEKKNFRMILLTIVMTLLFAGTALAATGTGDEWSAHPYTEGAWEQQADSTWKFKDLNGQYLANCWIHWGNDEWYYVHTNGTVLTNAITPDDRFVDETGRRILAVPDISIYTDYRTLDMKQPIVVAEPNKYTSGSSGSRSGQLSINGGPMILTTITSEGSVDLQPGEWEKIIAAFPDGTLTCEDETYSFNGSMPWSKINNILAQLPPEIRENTTITKEIIE